MLTELSFTGSAPFPAGDQFTQSFTPAFTPQPFDDETVHYPPPVRLRQNAHTRRPAGIRCFRKPDGLLRETRTDGA